MDCFCLALLVEENWLSDVGASDENMLVCMCVRAVVIARRGSLRMQSVMGITHP